MIESQDAGAQPFSMERCIMSIKVKCHSCGSMLSVADALAGKRGKCPNCQHLVNIPAAGANSSANSSAAVKPIVPPAPPPAPAKPAAAGPASPITSSRPPVTGASVPPGQPTKPSAAPAPGSTPAVTAVKEKPGPPPPTAQPQPAAAVSSEEAEAAAQAAFADAPVAPEDQAKIEFECEWCGHKIQVPVSEGNKRIPCTNAECRRIVKVPQPAGKAKEDWRANKNLRPGIKPNEVVPDDVMGGPTTTISQETKEELLTPRRPVTWGQLIARLIVVGVLLGGMGWGGLKAYSWWVGQSGARALEAAKTYADDPETRPVHAAALHEWAARYYQRSGQSGAAADADTEFKKGLGAISAEPLPRVAGGQERERDFVLIDLALGQIDMAGTADEVEAGTRIRWDEAHKGAAAALRAIRSTEARMEGLCQVVHRLVARKEVDRALPLANQVFTEDFEKGDALARVALELYRAGHTEPAKPTYEKDVLPLFQDSKTKEWKKKELLFPSAVALAETLKLKFPTEDSTRIQALGRIGRVEGLATRGEPDQARTEAGKAIDDETKLRAWARLVAVNPQDTKALEEALAKTGKQRYAAWPAYRLVEAGLKAKVEYAKLEPVANAIADPVLRERAQLALFRAQLEQSRKPVEDAVVEKVGDPQKVSVAHALARLLQSEHNTRHAGDWAKTVQKWPDPTLKAFGQLGLALGMEEQK